jgi:hypothetical protein
MQSKHGLALLLLQGVIFLAALFLGFKMLSPRMADPKVDLSAVTFNVGRAGIAYGSRRGSFANADELLRSMPMLPTGVGVEVRSADSSSAVLETRFQRHRCLLRLGIRDSIPGRPECR